MAKLNTYVNVDGTWYGPGDGVPSKVASQITNPKVWADGGDVAESSGEGVEVKEPPRGGPGSSADAWRAFMVSHGFEVPDDATAKDMQSSWDSRDKD